MRLVFICIAKGGTIPSALILTDLPSLLMTAYLSTHETVAARNTLISFLDHAEKTILRHSQELRTLCAHPRRVVSRKARQFYAQQLFLHRIHQELLQKVRLQFPSLGDQDRQQVYQEIEVFKAMQLQLATRFFRFLNRNRQATATAVQLAKVAG